MLSTWHAICGIQIKFQQLNINICGFKQILIENKKLETKIGFLLLLKILYTDDCFFSVTKTPITRDNVVVRCWLVKATCFQYASSKKKQF